MLLEKKKIEEDFKFSPYESCAFTMILGVHDLYSDMSFYLMMGEKFTSHKRSIPFSIY